MLQQLGVYLELAAELKAWFQEPWHTALPPSPTHLTPPPLRPKLTETSPPTNSPHPRPPAHSVTSGHQHPLPPPNIGQSPILQDISSASLTWCVFFSPDHQITQPAQEGLVHCLAHSPHHQTYEHTGPSISAIISPITPFPLIPHNVSNNCSQGFLDRIGLYPLVGCCFNGA